MRELALFAGAGGGILGGRLLGWRTVCAVELDPYCRRVLMQRQNDGVLEPFPIWDDVRTFDGTAWVGLVDVVSAGFPCQPFSVVGKQRAESDERNLWPETARILGEVRPRYALLENVPGLAAHTYFGIIIGDLAALGYDARWGAVGADDVGASHKRERLWIVAHTERKGLEGYAGNGALLDEQGWDDEEQGGSACKGSLRSWWSRDPSEPACAAEFDECECCEEPWCAIHAEHFADCGCYGVSNTDDPPAQSYVGRVAHGVASRVDRLRALGNGQVPLVARTAWRLLTDGA